MQNISKARVTSKFNLITFNLPNPNHTYLYSLIKYLNKHDHFLKLRFSVMVSYFRKFQSSYNFSQKYFENFLVRIRKIQFENFMFHLYLPFSFCKCSTLLVIWFKNRIFYQKSFVLKKLMDMEIIMKLKNREALSRKRKNAFCSLHFKRRVATSSLRMRLPHCFAFS